MTRSTTYRPDEIHVALGLELLSGLLYWKMTGQVEMLAAYRRRFQRWLDGDAS